MPRPLWRSLGGGAVSCERATPVWGESDLWGERDLWGDSDLRGESDLWGESDSRAVEHFRGSGALRGVEVEHRRQEVG